MLLPPSLFILFFAIFQGFSNRHRHGWYANAFILTSKGHVAQGLSNLGYCPFTTSSTRLERPVSFQVIGNIRIRYKSGRTATGMNMMFDQLSSAITAVTKNLTGKRMTERGIQNALKDVRRALLDADVNVEVADALIDGVKKRSIGTKLIDGVTADQQFVKIMYDELLDIMGGAGSGASVGEGPSTPASTLAVGSPGKPAVVLLAGLQGAGKTTAAGKLAFYLKEREVDYDAVRDMRGDDFTQPSPVINTGSMPRRKRKVLLAAADVYRPAAIAQLEVLGESTGVDVFSLGSDADPVDIATQAVERARKGGYDTVLIDTAGRQVIDDDLMDELGRIKDKVDPAETLLVVDAMTGQEAASLTASFDAAVGITGAVLTKMDGDSRGGAAVSVRGVSGKPIKFVGTGEKTTDLEPFYPDRMASRILGMGDVISLVEKASMDVSDAEAAKMTEKMMEAKFDFDDFMKQSEVVTKMGSMANVAKMMPGLGGRIDNDQMKLAETRMKRSRAMICSMTRKERADPDLLITDKTARSRLRRITVGSGLNLQDGLNFMSEFQKMRTMMSRMGKQMGAGGGGGIPGNDSTGMEPAMAGGGVASQGNRAMRRAAKKAKKGGRGRARGFG